jgi:hypothetical protein
MGRGLAGRALAGVLVGVVWGALARLFMRLVSTEPDFSWAGTLVIIGLGVIFWGAVGLVSGARSTGRSRWWRLAGVPALLIFVGQGLVFVPGAALVACGLAVRSAWQRAVLLVAGLAGTYWLMTLLDDEQFLQPRTQSLGFVLVVVCTGMLGFGLHELLRRWSAPTEAAATTPSPAAYAR